MQIIESSGSDGEDVWPPMNRLIAVRHPDRDVLIEVHLGEPPEGEQWDKEKIIAFLRTSVTADLVKDHPTP